MKSKIIEKTSTKLRLEIEIALNPASMLKSEEQIQLALNEAGICATEVALEQFDTTGEAIVRDGVKLTSKGQKKKNYQCSWGVAKVLRHVYQPSTGGQTFCPLEADARILHGATPHLCRQVSSKYSQMSSGKVQEDLLENHGRHLSRDYIQKLSGEVGKLIVLKEEDWSYVIPVKIPDVQVISIGMDGTTMPIRSEGYREAMNGTISFYDGEQNRLHTIYLAQAPQYGKSDFKTRFSKEIAIVQKMFPTATYIGLADGAKENWTFLEQYVEETILDYWHVCEYLTKASKAYSRSTYEKKQWLKEARRQLKEDQDGAETLLTEMKGFRKKRKVSKNAREELETAITYFTNHLHQMDYSRYETENYPIGSGVTEAACKVIIKQRTNHSGMRWYIDRSQKVLNIRALHRTKGRWKQFWNHVDKLGIAA